MKLDFSLNLSQEQKLIMTQNMQLSIKILQMSSAELREFVNKEIEENPVMESDFNLRKDSDDVDYKKVSETIDYDGREYNSYSGKDYDEEYVSQLNFVSEKKTLKEYLYEQLRTDKSIGDIGVILEYMVESIDGRGYLDEPIESICKRFNIEEEKGIRALKRFQNLEPAGIGARSLKECLIIQLEREGKLDSNIEKIIIEYLELVADNRYKEIAKKLGITQLDAQNYGDMIRSLEPKPSRGYFTGDEVKFITPDAYIKKIDDEYIVIMNNDVVPKISINNSYKDILLSDKEKKAESYIKEKIGNAMFIMKSIDKRESTLKIILEDIIRRQKDYFNKGRKYLIPMMIKDVAEDINMHESTVSRAIKDKYILTSYGTIKIKDLFTSGYSTSCSDNKDISSNKIKNMIKEIIDNEDNKKPLSDELICAELSKNNLNISRRTVAKYREEMGIKSSAKRKRI